MTGKEVRMGDQVGAADHIFAEAQMGNGKAAGFF